MALRRLIIIWILCLLGSIATLSQGKPPAKQTTETIAKGVRRHLIEDGYFEAMSSESSQERMAAVENLAHWMRTANPSVRLDHAQERLESLISSQNLNLSSAAIFVYGELLPYQHGQERANTIALLKRTLEEEIKSDEFGTATGRRDPRIMGALVHSLREQVPQSPLENRAAKGCEGLGEVYEIHRANPQLEAFR